MEWPPSVGGGLDFGLTLVTPQLSPRLESFAGPGKGDVLTTYVPSRTGGRVILGKSRGHREGADLQRSAWGGEGAEPDKTAEQRGCGSSLSLRGGGARSDYRMVVNWSEDHGDCSILC